MKSEIKSLLLLMTISIFILFAIVQIKNKKPRSNYIIYTPDRYYYSVEKPQMDKTTRCIAFISRDNRSMLLCGTYAIQKIKKPQEEE